MRVLGLLRIHDLARYAKIVHVSRTHVWPLARNVSLHGAALTSDMWRELWRTAPASRPVLHQRFNHMVHYNHSAVWLAQRPVDRQPVGMALVEAYLQSSSECCLRLFVTPHARRRGIATELLRHVKESTRSIGISSLICATWSHVPGGADFATRIDGEPIETRLITTARLDLRRLRADIGTDSACYVSCHVGLDLDSASLLGIAPLRRLVAQQYKQTQASFATDDDHAAGFRAYITRAAMNGVAVYTLLARAHASDEVVGYSTYVWDPLEPTVLSHSELAVAPSRKNRGVATALIHARQRIVAALPTVTSVRWTRQIDSIANCGRPEGPLDVALWQTYETCYRLGVN